jgi:hypothetical protein
MRTSLIISAGVVLFLMCGSTHAADNCVKECQLSFQACAKNHSQAACKNERDICVKHCQKK